MYRYKCSHCGHKTASAALSCPNCLTRFDNFLDMRRQERVERYTGIFAILGIFLGGLAAPLFGLGKDISALMGIFIAPAIAYPLIHLILHKIDRKWRTAGQTV